MLKPRFEHIPQTDKNETALYNFIKQDLKEYNEYMNTIKVKTHVSFKLRKRTCRTLESYKHHYPRTVKTRLRTTLAVEYLRSKYKLSMNKIAEIVGVSTRTVHKRIKNSVQEGFIKFNSALRRSKNSTGIINTKGQHRSWLGLKRLIQAYIFGQIDNVYVALGDFPP